MTPGRVQLHGVALRSTSLADASATRCRAARRTAGVLVAVAVSVLAVSDALGAAAQWRLGEPVTLTGRTGLNPPMTMMAASSANGVRAFAWVKSRRKVETVPSGFGGPSSVVLRPALAMLGLDQLGRLQLHQLRGDCSDSLADHVSVLVGCRHGVSFVFQTFNLFPALMALENVEFGADVGGRPESGGGRRRDARASRARGPLAALPTRAVGWRTTACCSRTLRKLCETDIPATLRVVE